MDGHPDTRVAILIGQDFCETFLATPILHHHFQ
jgi:hypothetical protein